MNELTWFLIALAVGAGMVIWFVRRKGLLDENKAQDAWNEIIEDARNSFKKK